MLILMLWHAQEIILLERRIFCYTTRCELQLRRFLIGSYELVHARLHETVCEQSLVSCGLLGQRSLVNY
jgi:hypothetical protein